MSLASNSKNLLLVHVGGAADGRVEFSDVLGNTGRRTIEGEEYVLRPVVQNGEKIYFYVAETNDPDDVEVIENQIEFWMEYLTFVDVASLARFVRAANDSFPFKHLLGVDAVGRRYLEPVLLKGEKTNDIPDAVRRSFLVRLALHINSILSKRDLSAPTVLVYCEVFEGRSYKAGFEQNKVRFSFVLKSIEVEVVNEGACRE